LIIKGAENDEAVLCTSSTTFAIKYVSTSNTVLLIPPQHTAPQAENMGSSADGKDRIDQANAGVMATAAGLIELVETAPRLDELKSLLNQRPYTEDLDEEQVFYAYELSFS
jgi:sister chromatid cohesion protein DCC1